MVSDERFCPYKGLMPYTEKDVQFFFGRKRDQEIISASLFASHLTILYGASGVGKTSVLQAGVAYHLRQKPRQAVVVFKAWREDPVAALKAVVAEEVARTLAESVMAPKSIPLDEFLKACTAGLRGPLMIILDQFEEYFLYHPQDKGPDSFAAQFARAVNRTDLPVSFLVAIREEALSKLDRFKARILHLFDNRLRLEHLDREAALEAIKKPLEEYNRTKAPPGEKVSIEDGLAEKVIEQVKTGRVLVGEMGHGQVGVPEEEAEARVETPYLQLVLTRLWDEEMQAHSRTLRQETLNRLGGAKRIVRTHLDEVMQRLPRDQRDVSEKMFRYLVTPSGAKIAYTASDLTSYAQVPQERILPVLQRLSGSDIRVLRAVAPATGETHYEVFHDVLARAIPDWRARYREQRQAVSRRRRLRIIAGGVAAAITIIALGLLLLFQMRIVEYSRKSWESGWESSKEIAEATATQVAWQAQATATQAAWQVQATATAALVRLRNSDFSEGLSSWSKLPTRGRGEINVQLTSDDPAHGAVVELIRTDSDDDLGYVSIVQALPFPWRVTRVKVGVKVISHSLRNPGSWSCAHGGKFDYPVHIYLWSGDEIAWNWGFLTEDDGGAGCKAPNYTLVTENEWFSYDSGPLDVSKVTEVRVAGEGWDFHVRVDNVEVSGNWEQ